MSEPMTRKQLIQTIAELQQELHDRFPKPGIERGKPICTHCGYTPQFNLTYRSDTPWVCNRCRNNS